MDRRGDSFNSDRQHNNMNNSRNQSNRSRHYDSHGMNGSDSSRRRRSISPARRDDSRGSSSSTNHAPPPSHYPADFMSAYGGNAHFAGKAPPPFPGYFYPPQALHPQFVGGEYPMMYPPYYMPPIPPASLQENYQAFNSAPVETSKSAPNSSIHSSSQSQRKDSDNASSNHGREADLSSDRNNSSSASNPNAPPAFPCRVIFVRNIHYNVPEKEIHEIFSKFGEIKNLFNLIEKRGMVFITYFDLRSAKAAKEKMQDFILRDRRLDIHYSLPKEADITSDKCDKSKNQGTLFMTVKYPSSPISRNDVNEVFGKYGDIKDVRNFRDTKNQRFIEFYDSRACVRAYEEMNGKNMKGGKVELKLSFDLSIKQRKLAAEYAGETKSGGKFHVSSNRDKVADENNGNKTNSSTLPSESASSHGEESSSSIPPEFSHPQFPLHYPPPPPNFMGYFPPGGHMIPPVAGYPPHYYMPMGNIEVSRQLPSSEYNPSNNSPDTSKSQNTAKKTSKEDDAPSTNTTSSEKGDDRNARLLHAQQAQMLLKSLTSPTLSNQASVEESSKKSETSSSQKKASPLPTGEINLEAIQRLAQLLSGSKTAAKA